MPEFELPIGPQHPALKEPESFRLKIDGETVIEADVRLGYNHRGIEKACETRTYMQCLYLVERICGICSHTHATAFTQAVEARPVYQNRRGGAGTRAFTPPLAWRGRPRSRF